MALIGPLADAQDQMQGSWAIAYRKADIITLKTALEERVASSGGALFYAQGTQIVTTSEAGFAAAEEAARKADVVVMALGESVNHERRSRCARPPRSPRQPGRAARANCHAGQAGGAAGLLRPPTGPYHCGTTG